MSVATGPSVAEAQLFESHPVDKQHLVRSFLPSHNRHRVGDRVEAGDGAPFRWKCSCGDVVTVPVALVDEAMRADARWAQRFAPYSNEWSRYHGIIALDKADAIALTSSDPAEARAACALFDTQVDRLRVDMAHLARMDAEAEAKKASR